jgi:hypothetical protein
MEDMVTRGGHPAWGLGVGLATPHVKKSATLQNVTRSLVLAPTHYLGRPKQREIDMRSGPSECEVSGGKPEKDHYNDLDIDGRKILQEYLVRTISLLHFDTTRTAYKTTPATIFRC